MPDYRIIITGCRDWTDPKPVRAAINDIWHEIDFRDRLVVVHGNCPSGADAMAKAFVLELQRLRAQTSLVDMDIEQEPHPADWKQHGKAAGMIRNREMAQRGADLCIAFWDGRSPGTGEMIKEATQAGIPVRIVPKARRDA